MGKLFAFIGPSGAGKTTIVKALGLKPVLTTTTRKMRSGEIAGDEYNFVTEEEYTALLNQGCFVEHVNNYGYYYGTLRRDLIEALGDAKPRASIVTYEGFMEIKSVAEGYVTSIFIYASKDEISSRLKKRVEEGNLSLEAYERRLDMYDHEVTHARYCDFIVPSSEGCLELAVQEIRDIIERLI